MERAIPGPGRTLRKDRRGRGANSGFAATPPCALRFDTMNWLPKRWSARNRLPKVIFPILLLLVSCGGGGDDAEERWYATWGVAPHAQDTPLKVQNTTLRQEIRIGIGGERVRVRLSNRFGTDPLRIDAATIAVAADSAAVIDPTTIEAIEFGGESGVEIAPGDDVLSDPVELSPTSRATLSLSLYFSGEATLAATHGTALRPSFFAHDDRSRDVDLASTSRRNSWFVLVGVEVETRDRQEVFVALGDSITDGFGAREVGGSWPERLSELLGGAATVVNAGISGNRILRAGGAGFGPSAIQRFDDDVLVPAGVTTLIVQEGINDIQAPGVPAVFGDDPPAPRLTSADVIAGLAEIAERGRAAGLRVVGGTLLPYRILPIVVADGETVRTEVNEWIRTSDAFDAVIDFDAAVSDPELPSAMRRDYDSGDTLHPNDAGYQAMAEAALAVLDTLREGRVAADAADSRGRDVP